MTIGSTYIHIFSYIHIYTHTDIYIYTRSIHIYIYATPPPVPTFINIYIITIYTYIRYIYIELFVCLNIPMDHHFPFSNSSVSLVNLLVDAMITDSTLQGFPRGFLDYGLR